MRIIMRTIDYEARKKEILAQAIDYYIRTAQPVSSEVLVKDHNLELSPATIRNVFADLEQEGYLTHLHTSAGRIPTQLGYRFYVDNIMNEIQLLDAEKKRIEFEFRKGIKQLEILLEKTSLVISQLTHCTGIVSLTEWQNRIFYKGTSFVVEQPEFKNLDKIRHLLKALDEKERLLEIINCDLEERLKIYIGTEIACSDINDCSLIVSSFEKKNKPVGRMAVLGPTRMEYAKVVSTLQYMSVLVSRLLDDF
ncbi:MAG: hypothetical protein Q8O13_06610 [Candidatus Omnitrophota bacterium]|nr:hypothetical protein [Candidatus Omnitrophota bacterium]